MCRSCRYRQEFSNDYLLAKIGVDTAENETSPVTNFIPNQAIQFHIDIRPLLLRRYAAGTAWTSSRTNPRRLSAASELRNELRNLHIAIPTKFRSMVFSSSCFSVCYVIIIFPSKFSLTTSDTKFLRISAEKYSILARMLYVSTSADRTHNIRYSRERAL